MTDTKEIKDCDTMVFDMADLTVFRVGHSLQMFGRRNGRSIGVFKVNHVDEGPMMTDLLYDAFQRGRSEGIKVGRAALRRDLRGILGAAEDTEIDFDNEDEDFN